MRHIGGLSYLAQRSVSRARVPRTHGVTSRRPGNGHQQACRRRQKNRRRSQTYQPNTKSEGETRCGRQGVGAGSLPADREAAIEAWVELTALVLACGSSETALADEFGYDLRASVGNAYVRPRTQQENGRRA
jgi:hypothetical protein